MPTNTSIRQQCLNQEICQQIPFDGNQNLAGQSCVRLVEEAGVFYSEWACQDRRVPVSEHAPAVDFRTTRPRPITAG